MEQIPYYISGLFIACTGYTLFCVYKAARGNRNLLLVLLAWLLLQGLLALSGFYLDTSGFPPRFALLLLPALLSVLLLFITPAGKRMTGGLDAGWLYWLHAVRLPVELVLLALYTCKQVPQLMTFEGRNFDIFSGITAPIVALFVYGSSKGKSPILVVWNIICLLLLLNIMIHALLSAPLSFQQFAFDQPNVGVLYFPYIWLPGFIVPAVLFSHVFLLREYFRTRRIARLKTSVV